MVVFVEKNDSIREAAVIMRKYHVGDVVVIEEREDDRYPIGILTDRDIVIQITAEDVDLDAVTVGDVMSFDLITAREDDDILDTIKKMRNKGIRRIPVVNDRGVLQGILTFDDFVELLSEQLMDLTKLITGGRNQEFQKRP